MGSDPAASDMMKSPSAEVSILTRSDVSQVSSTHEGGLVSTPTHFESREYYSRNNPGWRPCSGSPSLQWMPLAAPNDECASAPSTTRCWRHWERPSTATKWCRRPSCAQPHPSHPRGGPRCGESGRKRLRRSDEARIPEQLSQRQPLAVEREAVVTRQLLLHHAVDPNPGPVEESLPCVLSSLLRGGYGTPTWVAARSSLGDGR